MADLPDAPAGEARDAPRRLFAALWVASAVLLLAWVGRPPVERNQEARVLETARQMLGTGWRGWMVPLLNGEPRLKKPPLAYWLTASSYKVFGVSEGAGRVPAVLAGWLTLAVTFAAARRLFGEHAALVAAACLLGSYLFFRYTRLAETDPPATLFVTVAIYATLRASGPIVSTTGATPVGAVGRAIWFHVAAAATAGAVLAKGGPAVFPALFLVGWAVASRRWRILWEFIRCGAPLTLALLALPWFIYVGRVTPVAAVLGDEVNVVVTGVDHGLPAYMYAPLLLLGPVPWTPVAIAGVVAAVASLRPRRRGASPSPTSSDPGLGPPAMPLRALIVWLLAVLVPLLLIGNKQFHYLLPAMPPLMILAAWAIDHAAGPRPGANVLGTVTRRLLTWTGVAAMAAAAAFPLVGFLERKHVHPSDFAMTAVLASAAVLVALAGKWGGARAAVVAGAGAFALIAAAGEAWWLPTVRAWDMRLVAREVAARYGDGPYCFYGANDSLPLRFYLRKTIPRYETPQALERAATENDNLVVIAQTKSSGRKPAPAPPPGFVPAGEPLLRRDQVFAFYRYGARGPSSSTTR